MSCMESEREAGEGKRRKRRGGSRGDGEQSVAGSPTNHSGDERIWA